MSLRNIDPDSIKRHAQRRLNRYHIKEKLDEMEGKLYEANNISRNFSLSALQSILNHPLNCKMSSHFNCMLTPFRIKLLIIGFKKLYVPCITMDIINIIINYFGSQIVWCQNNYVFYKRDTLFEYLSSSEMSLSRQKTIENYVINNDLEFIIDLSNNTGSSEYQCHIILTTEWKYVSTIIFRIRLYFISNKDESVTTHQRIVTLWKNERTRKYDIFDKIPKNDFKFGAEIEILHIRWNSGKTWSKWCYPWNDNKNDLQLLLKDNWFWTHFHKNCFGVNDKYIILQGYGVLYGDDDKDGIFEYTKCKSLSKFNDMIMQINKDEDRVFNDAANKPLFVPLNEFIESQMMKLKQVDVIFKLLAEKVDNNIWNGHSDKLRNRYNALKDTLSEYLNEPEDQH